MTGLDATTAMWPAAARAPEDRPGLLDALSARRRAIVRRLPGVASLERLYPAFLARTEPAAADRALAALDIRWTAAGVRALPSSGPSVVICNHPFGILDGLVLASMIRTRRADARLLATNLLAALPDFADDLFLVDIFGGRSAVPKNAVALRRVIRWVRGGGCLVVFPSGAVSHFHASSGAIVDPVWPESIARLVRLTGAAVTPCAIDGRNSTAFQIAGLLHPSFRTLLLARELQRRRHSSVSIHVGSLIPAHALDAEADGDVTSRLRSSCYVLLDRTAGLTSHTRRTAAQEATALIATRSLVRSRQFSVFHATAEEMPALLHQIGTARERTFRAAGEGTGHPVDLDAFDRHYVHLCLWDEAGGRLAGAYRLGRVDAGVEPAACYTRTLFEFDARFTRAVAPALELGRAFVTPEYQRQPAPLMLLWSGIARFVAQHPEYRYLFGAVSLSATYTETSRRLIARYLQRRAWEPRLAALIAPRHPFSTSGGDRVHDPTVPDTLADLDVAVADIERSGTGVPVLLKHYLKLNARAFGFSIDPAFGSVVDAMVVVDLPAIPQPVLARYMGSSDATAYRSRHLSFPIDAGRLSA